MLIDMKLIENKPCSIFQNVSNNVFVDDYDGDAEDG